ncbi:MAG: hypothetical protein L0Y72_15515 [Gemmataceae bacterium]|nr:hypothetical protein [Gemmataceae bacterium]MCI0740454.1 hypothetical protein [Gemmataceae bacterium]
MMCLSKWISGTLAIALLVGAAAAEDIVVAGKVKSINADNKGFSLTDSADKVIVLRFGDKLVVNRAGKESKGDLKVGDLKVGDPINICYEKGDAVSTAHYILVREGKSENCDLILGNVKSYDSDKKELNFINANGKSSTYSMGKAMVRLNMEDAKIDIVKTGDHALLIVDTVEDKSTLRSVMVNRPAKRDANRVK